MRSIPGIIISKLIGIMIFLVMLVMVNSLSVESHAFQLFVTFLNINAILLIMMSLIFMIGEIFFALEFPFNLPAPIFSSIASLFLTAFIFRIFNLADTLLLHDTLEPLSHLKWFIYPVVFFAVLIGGYATIFVKHHRPKKGDKETIKKKIAGVFREIADSIDNRHK